jgi:group I intron endonuclease
MSKSTGADVDFTGKAVVYQIFNLVTGGFYVGSTIHWGTRKRTHLRKLRGGVHHCPHLQASWVKHGEAAFEFRVVQIVEDAAQLMAEEQKWLDKHHGTPDCYNFAKYVDSSARGIKFLPAHREAISAGLKEYYTTNEAPFTGRQHTEETKRKISEAKIGVPKSEAHKQKIREARLGTTASAETKAKLSAMRKGKVKSAEWVAKYNKPILEVSSGVVYPSLKAVKDAFGMSPGTLDTALKSGKPLSKGPHKGKAFAYVDRDPSA